MSNWSSLLIDHASVIDHISTDQENLIDCPSSTNVLDSVFALLGILIILVLISLSVIRDIILRGSRKSNRMFDYIVFYFSMFATVTTKFAVIEHRLFKENWVPGHPKFKQVPSHFSNVLGYVMLAIRAEEM